MATRGILTLAFGKPKYIEMAKSLARSLILHDPTLMRAIVTDSTDPELGDLFTYRIDLRPEYGANVRQKMFLDRYTPFDETLFIDSDSLAARPLDAFWSAFQPVPFGVCGVRLLYPGEHDEYLDVDFILNHFNLTTLPKFNGGIYYFKRSPAATAVFATARDLLSQASELRFSSFRNDGPADEALYSVAMAMHGLTVTDMGTGGMWTPIGSTIPLALDIPNGICTFIKRGRALRPHIFHVATFTESRFYLRECSRLEHLAHGHPNLTRSEELQLTSTVATLWMRRKANGLRRRLLHLAPPSSHAVGHPVHL
jgi:hypothetical protein